MPLDSRKCSRAEQHGEPILVALAGNLGHLLAREGTERAADARDQF
jgi:hypothetical protein